MIKGRCECGLVSFESDSRISDFGHCHCSQCRRLHGAAFATFAEIESDKLRYISGEDSVKAHRSSRGSERLFCAECGSNILVTMKSYPQYVYLCMGVVDEYPDLPSDYHAYVGSKAPWHDITDDAPQYIEDPTD